MNVDDLFTELIDDADWILALNDELARIEIYSEGDARQIRARAVIVINRTEQMARDRLHRERYRANHRMLGRLRNRIHKPGPGLPLGAAFREWFRQNVNDWAIEIVRQVDSVCITCTVTERRMARAITCSRYRTIGRGSSAA